MTLYYAAGALYAVLFMLLAAKKPRATLWMCFAIAPLQRAIPGVPFKLSLADLNVILAFTVFCLQNLATAGRIRIGPLGAPVAFYLLVCAVSSIRDWRGSSTAVSFTQMIPYLVVAVVLFSSYGRGLEDVRPAFYGLIGVGMFLGLSVCAKFSGYIYGFHKNAIGGVMACVLIVSMELWLAATEPKKRRILLACIVVSFAALLITVSRGAWLSAIVGLAVVLSLRKDARAVLRFGAVMVPLIAVGWSLLPAEDKDYATGFDSHRHNIKARWASIDMALGKFRQEPVLGVGVGLRKEMDATNVVMTTLAETGAVGFIAFVSIHWALWRMARKAKASLPTGTWAFSCLAIGTALVMAKFAHGLVDHYWSRGTLLLAWAGAGLVTRAFYLSQAPVARALPGRAAARQAARAFPAGRAAPGVFVPRQPAMPPRIGRAPSTRGRGDMGPPVN